MAEHHSSRVFFKPLKPLLAYAYEHQEASRPMVQVYTEDAWRWQGRTQSPRKDDET